MCPSAGTGCRCRGELSTLRSWDVVASFLVSSDLVIYLDTSLDIFIKYVGESDLVGQGFFEFAIEAFLKE